MILLLAWLAGASPEAQIRGGDLDAWEALTQADAPATTSALLAFIDAWPDSPLAERAWALVQDRADLDSGWVRRNRRLVAALDRSLAHHQTKLRQSAEPGPVVLLDAAGETPRVATPWHAGPRLGAAFEGYGPGLIAGAQVGRGAISGIARLHVGAETFAELMVELHPARWRAARVGLGIDSLGRAAAQVGFATAIRPWLSFEAGGGLRVGSEGVGPLLRVELAAPLSRRR